MSAKTFSLSGRTFPNKVSQAIALTANTLEGIQRVAFVRDSFRDVEKIKAFFSSVLPDPTHFIFHDEVVNTTLEYNISYDSKVYYQKSIAAYDDAVIVMQFNNSRIISFMYDRLNISGGFYNTRSFRNKLQRMVSQMSTSGRYHDVEYLRTMSEANYEMHLDNIATFMLGTVWATQNIRQEFYKDLARQLPHKGDIYFVAENSATADEVSAIFEFTYQEEEQSRDDGTLVPVAYGEISGVTSMYPRRLSYLLSIGRVECKDYYSGDFIDFYRELFDHDLWVTNVNCSRDLQAIANDLDVVVLAQVTKHEDMTNVVSLPALKGRYLGNTENKLGISTDIVKQYVDIVQDAFTTQWMLKSNSNKISTVLANGEYGSLYFERRFLNDDLLDLAFHNCDYCGSRTYADIDIFVESVHEVRGEYVEKLEQLVANVDETLEEMYAYITDRADEESGDYYCRECGMGEGYDDDEDGQDIIDVWNSRSKLSTVLAPFGKTVVAADSYHHYYNFLNVTDTNEPKSIDPHSFYENYFVHSYDHTPPIDYLNTVNENPEKDDLLYLGLEWEMDGGGYGHQSAFVINSALSNNKHYSWTMRDGSLEYGIEIATMPATLNAHMNMLDYDSACAVASALDYRGHDVSTAGIHVHMSRRFFGKDTKIQMYKGALMALIMERNWDDFVKFSRRRYNRIDQWAKKKDYLQALPANPTADDYQTVFNNKYGYDKYVALNTTKSQTFEMRIFRSTLKADTIKATLQFAHNLAHWVKNNDLVQAQSVSFQDIIDYIPHKELSEYWQVAKEREVRD